MHTDPGEKVRIYRENGKRQEDNLGKQGQEYANDRQNIYRIFKGSGAFPTCIFM
jgi:hypothetical protein